MLIVQLVFAAFVGAIAIGCVWWVVSWVVRDNLDDWAKRWIVEMESLGTGLYLDETDERFLELENYLARFPEILYVRYYDSDGRILYVEQAANDATAYPALEREEFLLLSEDSEAYNIDTSYEPLVRISQAVVIEAIVKIDLFNADSMEDLQTKSSVVGYVELGLDYDRYDREILGSIVWGSVFILLAFFAMTMVGRIALRRAVQPLIDIQNPLEAMARGNLDIQVPESHHKEIANIGNALKTAINRIQERDKNLRRLANHDALTDLPNRNHLIDELKARMEKLVIEKCSGALLFIDLDKFKHVNDSYGHATGDSVLIQVAARLRQFVRKDDLVARYSGDEFVIFIAGVTSDRADEIARKLIQDLREYPLSHSAHSFSVGCSVGITVAPYPPIFTPEELISQADLACRQAKSNGRKRTSHFKADEGQLDSIKSDLDWQQKLERAIQQDDLVLEYQPIMNLSTTNINNYEVLVRLNDNGKL
ncbi:MAG: diguanylate cyclase, partial [Gammaproteobacteria bacterium]|nr:diguanylate cyclase [Gammaproteobacteria bacterium]